MAQAPPWEWLGAVPVTRLLGPTRSLCHPLSAESGAVLLRAAAALGSCWNNTLACPIYGDVLRAGLPVHTRPNSPTSEGIMALVLQDWSPVGGWCLPWRSQFPVFLTMERERKVLLISELLCKSCVSFFSILKKENRLRRPCKLNSGKYSNENVL